MADEKITPKIGDKYSLKFLSTPHSQMKKDWKWKLKNKFLEKQNKQKEVN